LATVSSSQGKVGMDKPVMPGADDAIPVRSPEAAALLGELEQLRATILHDAAPLLARFEARAGGAHPALTNLGHYLVLRHHDIRPLQRRLMRLGLSSLGRAESRVMPTLDAVIAALHALAGKTCLTAAPDEQSFFAGEMRLNQATDSLFGAPRPHRRNRIMVTLPSQAAQDADLVMALARAGMDVARINCAHDDAQGWRAMVGNVRKAGLAVGRDLQVLMDIAGPKLRTEAVICDPADARLFPGARFRLVAHGAPHTGDGIAVAAGVSAPEIVTRLRVGDRVSYDDGKIGGIVEHAEDGEAVIRVVRARPKGSRIKPEKGLNCPDTSLGLAPLTAKDEADIATVIACADMVGYSFVSRPEDIDLLDAALARYPRADAPLGLVAKIERPDAVKNLPDLIARAMPRGPFGVMIARGDLAAELGFERMAEMQEEILWICEAAGVPVIWATQVLEGLVKNGVPSRGEMTDAAMAARAECVMLNKGPAIGEAVALLDRLLGRMEDHAFKKTPTLRALTAW